MRISDWSSDVCSSDLLEAAVQAPHAGHRRRQRSADQKARTAGLVQEWRVDVGRVDEKVWPVAIACRAVRQPGQVIEEILSGMSQREVRVDIREAQLSEAEHHHGMGKASGGGKVGNDG